MKYIYFIFSIFIVISCILDTRNYSYINSELIWLVIGNLLYSSSAIAPAFPLKDNRAFCKYLCPIVVIFQANARYSLTKIVAKNKNECTQCKTCTQSSLVFMSILFGKGYVNTQECILCLTCTTSCPENILTSRFMYSKNVYREVHRTCFTFR